MDSFVYEQLAHRVIFKAGALDRLADEAARAGIRRALIVSTPDRRFVDQVERRLGNLAPGVYAGAAMHVPIEIANDARAQARSLNADACVAIGGGSAIGLAKA